MPRKNERLFRTFEEKPLNIGIRGVVAYCDNRNKRYCKKCMLHGFHELTYINLICRPIDDYPKEYKNIEQKVLDIKEVDDNGNKKYKLGADV